MLHSLPNQKLSSETGLSAIYQRAELNNGSRKGPFTSEYTALSGAVPLHLSFVPTRDLVLEQSHPIDRSSMG